MFYSSSASAQQYYLADVKKGQVGNTATPGGLVVSLERALTPPPLQVCVAVFPDDSSWYRAEIISVPDDNRVSVRYVDYGNTATVSRLGVRKTK